MVITISLSILVVSRRILVLLPSLYVGFVLLMVRRNGDTGVLLISVASLIMMGWRVSPIMVVSLLITTILWRVASSWGEVSIT